MGLRLNVTEQIARTILGREGVAAIWQLHVAAAGAHQTGHPVAGDAILEIAAAAEREWLRGEQTPSRPE